MWRETIQFFVDYRLIRYLVKQHSAHISVGVLGKINDWIIRIDNLIALP